MAFPETTTALSPSPPPPSIPGALADEINNLTQRAFRQHDSLRKAIDGIVGGEPPANSPPPEKLRPTASLDIQSAVIDLRNAFDLLSRQISRLYNENHPGETFK